MLLRGPSHPPFAATARSLTKRTHGVGPNQAFSPQRRCPLNVRKRKCRLALVCHRRRPSDEMTVLVISPALWSAISSDLRSTSFPPRIRRAGGTGAMPARSGSWRRALWGTVRWPQLRGGTVCRVRCWQYRGGELGGKTAPAFIPLSISLKRLRRLQQCSRVSDATRMRVRSSASGAQGRLGQTALARWCRHAALHQTAGNGKVHPAGQRDRRSGADLRGPARIPAGGDRPAQSALDTTPCKGGINWSHQPYLHRFCGARVAGPGDVRCRFRDCRIARRTCGIGSTCRSCRDRICAGPGGGLGLRGDDQASPARDRQTPARTIWPQLGTACPLDRPDGDAARGARSCGRRG